MSYKDIDKTLQLEFSERKLSAELLASRNLAKANSVKAYQKLSLIERDLIFEIAKLKATKKNSKDLEEQLKIAREQKQLILSKLNLKLSDLKPKYSCSNCNDTGFVSGVMCNCYKKRRNAELVKACGLDPKNLASFENFNTKICKSETHAKTLETLKEKLSKWADEFPNNKKKNIVISGTPGGGKTFITECLANKLFKRDFSVCFVSAFDMNQMLTKYHTTFDKSKDAHIAPLLYSDVLFIDDLGTEPITKNVTLNYLFLVLSERERMGKPIIISTNLMPENILDRYGERIYSRLASKLTGAFFHISGDDLRLSK